MWYRAHLTVVVFLVSLINFVWPWKIKQRDLDCLCPSDQFFWVFYVSSLLQSLNSANLLSLSHMKSSSCLNPSCLFCEPCLLLLCSSLSLDIKTEASYLNMSSTILTVLHRLCSCQLDLLRWSWRAARWCGERLTIKYSTKHKHKTSLPNTYTTEMLGVALMSALKMHNIIPSIHLTSKKGILFYC